MIFNKGAFILSFMLHAFHFLIFVIFFCRSAKPVPVTVDTDSDDPPVWLPAIIRKAKSGDSTGDFSLSPRAKKTPKRNRPAFLGLDDLKLKAECAVVIERINNPVLILLL